MSRQLLDALSQMTLLEVLTVLHYATVKLARRGLASITDLCLVGAIEDNVLSKAA